MICILPAEFFDRSFNLKSPLTKSERERERERESE